MSSEGMKKRGWLSWEEVSEGRWYWWWNEDPDSCPVPVSVSRSGHTGNDFFATPGQLGWNRHQDLSEMRGWWMPLIEPDPRSSDEQCKLTRQELIAENERLRKVCEEFRDTVLNQRHQLSENGMDNDQVNDVLNAFDETIGAALGEKAEPEQPLCRFKIGDKVRITTQRQPFTFPIGTVGTITSVAVDLDCFDVKRGNVVWSYTSQDIEKAESDTDEIDLAERDHELRHDNEQSKRSGLSHTHD